MTQKPNVNLNDTLHPFSNSNLNDSPELFPSETHKLVLTDEDDIGPWASDTLTPKLKVMPMPTKKTIVSSHIPSPSSNTPKTEAKHYEPSKFTLPIEEKHIPKPHKPVKERVHKPNDAEIFSNEIIKFRCSPPVATIGLVDLSPRTTNTHFKLKKDSSKLQLLIGNEEEQLESINQQALKSARGISSPTNEGSESARQKLSSRQLPQRVTIETEAAQPINQIGSLKIYSDTARSIKGFGLLEHGDHFSAYPKSTLHRKSPLKMRLAPHSHKMSGSKVFSYMHNGGKHKLPKESVAGIFSQGVRITASQKNPKETRKVSPASKMAPLKDIGYVNPLPTAGDDIKDKLKVLRKIRQSKVLPSIDDYKLSERRDTATSQTRRLRTPSPVRFDKSLDHQITKTEPNPLQRAEGEVKKENKGHTYTNSYSTAKLSNSALVRNMYFVEDSSKKGMSYRERTESFACTTFENERSSLNNNEVHDSKDPLNKLKQIVASKSSSNASSAQSIPYKGSREIDLGQEFYTGSYSNNMRKTSADIKTFSFKKEAPTVIHSSKAEINPSTILSNKAKRPLKKPNIEIQAALLQDRTANKTLRMLKT